MIKDLISDAQALELAKIAGQDGFARIALAQNVFRSYHQTIRLGQTILAETTQANRDLFAHHFGSDFGDSRAWHLLIAFAGELA